MNLHRTTKKTDWQKVSPSSWNLVQKIASRTNGVVTPANILTLFGLCIVLYGLWLVVRTEFLYGISALIIGRLLDIADGFVADKTATKSTVGEMFDAGVDKFCTFLTIGVLFFTNIVSWWVIIMIVAPQIVIVGVTFYKKQKHQALHPVYSGKISMALVWVSCIGFVALKEFPFLTLGVYGCAVLSIILGWHAAWGYTRTSVK